jgi:hypothetical protein
MKLRRKNMVAEVTVTATMSAVVQKDIKVAKRGYRDAVDRLEGAVAAGGDQGDAVYIAIAEAANWLDSLADWMKLSGNVDVQAVVFARHRTHHHLASIAYFDERSGAWVWRPASQLPVPEDARHSDETRKPSYVNRLEGHSVLEVFRRLHPVIAAAS